MRKLLFLMCGLLLAVLTVDSLTYAADDASAITEKDRKEGMKKTPKLIKKAGLACNLIDARKLPSVGGGSFSGSGFSSGGGAPGGGGGGAPGGGGGAPGGGGDFGGGGGGDFGGGGGAPGGFGGGGTQYEVACSEGLGYIITSGRGDPTAMLCLGLSNTPGMAGPPEGGPEAGRPQGPGGSEGQPPGGPGGPGRQAECLLPDNANQIAALKPFIEKVGLACEPVEARNIGQTASNTLIEVACATGQGVILATSIYPDIKQDVQYIGCNSLPEGSNVSCTLTDPEFALNMADKLISETGLGCEVADHRYFGSNPDGDLYYEVACQDGAGYVLQQKVTGELAGVSPCADIGDAGGGCQLGKQ